MESCIYVILALVYSVDYQCTRSVWMCSSLSVEART